MSKQFPKRNRNAESPEELGLPPDHVIESKPDEGEHVTMRDVEHLGDLIFWGLFWVAVGLAVLYWSMS